LFVAEGEDLVDAGAQPEYVLRAGEDVDPKLLDGVSSLGSGTRVIGVYRQQWSEPGGDVSVYLHGVGDPGNVGTIIRSAHAFADGPVILGPGCADPYSPKAVRASMGSIFARPPARARFDDLPGTRVAFVAGGPAEYDVDTPVVLCFGSERGDLPGGAERTAGIPMRPGLDSLNVAMAATVALYERFRMARHG
jgi:TrmH family RNA methyltransferase